MKTIDKNSLITMIRSFDNEIHESAKLNNFSIEMIEKKDYGIALRAYVYLTYLYEKLEDINKLNDLDLFYNRYIWFLRFSKQKEKIDGYDPGINQQILRLFEEAEYLKLNIDWNIIQKISEDVENE